MEKQLLRKDLVGDFIQQRDICLREAGLPPFVLAGYMHQGQNWKHRISLRPTASWQDEEEEVEKGGGETANANVTLEYAPLSIVPSLGLGHRDNDRCRCCTPHP